MSVGLETQAGAQARAIVGQEGDPPRLVGLDQPRRVGRGQHTRPLLFRARDRVDAQARGPCDLDHRQLQRRAGGPKLRRCGRNSPMWVIIDQRDPS